MRRLPNPLSRSTTPRHLVTERRTRRSPAREQVRRRRGLFLEQLEDRKLLSTFTVTNTDDSGAGSLRQAILDANDNPGADEIGFSIPGAGIHTIAPLTMLPFTGGQITIDGTTQPGFITQGLHPIELSGVNLPQHSNLSRGLQLANDSLVRGLTINSFHSGIVVQADSNVRIEGNYVGLDPTGSFVPSPRVYDGQSMFNGIFLEGTSNAVVGGSIPEARNLIAGSVQGVFLRNASDNRIVGNAIDPSLNSFGVIGNGDRNRIGEPGAGNDVGVIRILGGSDNTIQANHVGIVQLLQNGTSNNLIGGSTAAERNVILSVEIFQDANHNKVQGNYIGVAADGIQRTERGNVTISVNAHHNIIGTDGDGANDNTEGNVIGGGVGISGVQSAYNVVAGNLIGTTFTGLAGLGLHPNGNYRTGVSIQDAQFNRIGTDGNGLGDSLERNVISSQGTGVRISGLNARWNEVAGNYIGTNSAGNAAIPNGVGVVFGGLNNLLGTDGDEVNDDAERNIISGNSDLGVTVAGFGATGINVVAGNYIGTNATGLLPLGNRIGLRVGSDTMIGGTTAATRNVISGNTETGLELNRASGTMVQGNYIGVDKTGTSSLENGGDGIWILNSSTTNTIGGAVGADNEAAAANIIAHNGRNGVTVSETLGVQAPPVAAVRNSIRGNSIFANAALGIDLAEKLWSGSGSPDDSRTYSAIFGVTPNDSLDADTGNNDFQNFPVLTAALSSATTTRIQSSLHSTPNAMFVLDFYASQAADPTGYGEGERWLGSVTVNTDTNGNWTDEITVGESSGGEFITATATDAVGNTSEFSAAIESESAVQIVTVDISPDSLNVDSNGTLTVVVFGAADFNAAQIDVGSVRFAGAGAWQSVLVDANHDGYLDLQLKVRRQDTTLAQIYADLLVDDHDEDGILDSTRQTAEVELTGETLDDALFSGSDDLTLFLSGRSLRELLEDLFG